MKRFFTLFFLLLLSFAAPKAQSASYDEFPITVTNGLTSYSLMSHYYWDSPDYTFSNSIKGVRLTFLSNNTGEQFNGYPAVDIAELTFYDKGYNIIQYSADQISVNSAESGSDDLNTLCDNSWSTYFSSAYKNASITPKSYVYIDITFQQPINTFFFTLVSGSMIKAPTSMVITECGTAYDGSKD